MTGDVYLDATVWRDVDGVVAVGTLSAAQKRGIALAPLREWYPTADGYVYVEERPKWAEQMAEWIALAVAGSDAP